MSLLNNDVFSYTGTDSHASAPEGVLVGSRLAVQPNLSVRGWPACAGSRALENFVALEDASVVERLRSAGACIAGFTRMAELGLGLEGDTSAAAVVSSACDAALVTDTLGEARVAAAEAGLIGFKPTFGTISRYGLIGLVPSMECLGVVARDINTVSRILQAISGPDERDFSLGGEFPDFTQSVPSGDAIKTAAIIPQSLSDLSPAETEAFESAIAALKKAGIATHEAPVEDYGLFRAVHQAVGAAEASSSAGKYDSVRYGHRAQKADDWNEMYLKSRQESFGPLVKAFLFQGAYFQFTDYAAFENACRIRRRLVDALDAVLRDSEIIVLPTRRTSVASGQAVEVSQVYDRFALTLAANVAGLPAVSLPGFMKTGADDLGLQIVARRLEDNLLLGCAARLLSTQSGDQ